MIIGFADKETERFWHTRLWRRLPQDIANTAYRKLRQIDVVSELAELRIPPGNRLESLKGNRRGQHSIRINDQWRICFRWTAQGAEDVEIVDYH
jgi:toxin HigB-1